MFYWFKFDSQISPGYISRHFSCLWELKLDYLYWFVKPWSVGKDHSELQPYQVARKKYEKVTRSCHVFLAHGALCGFSK